MIIRLTDSEHGSEGLPTCVAAKAVAHVAIRADTTSKVRFRC